MAPPPPQGSSPWAQGMPAEARGQDGWGAGPQAPAATPWLWLPIALSSLLLVLFAVVVNRQQAQAQRLGELLSRVQALEHSRALERTAVLEQQLRSMLTRLQALEKRSEQQGQLTQQLQSLEAELQVLRRTAGRVMTPLEEPLPPPRAQRPSDEPPASP